MSRLTVSHRRIRTMVVVAFLLLAADRAAMAQTGTATINGQVTDESGAVLPGVTVTATSPALQVPQVTAATDEVEGPVADNMLEDADVMAADQVASYDDMLTSLVQAALARVGMQQNDDMRKMAAWAALLAVPTMVAAIYGMNFKVMPELNWTWGYPGVMALMGVSCSFLYIRFRNRKWL